MAVKKPKKITQAKLVGPTKATLATGKPAGNLSKSTATLAKPAQAVKPTQPNTPAPAAQVAVPPTPLVTPAPRPSLNTATDRNSAMRRYVEAMNEVNTQIRDLAANYGGAPSVLQYGYTPGGADTTNQLTMGAAQPGSQLEVMLRNLKASKGNVNESYLAGGAWDGTQRVGKLNDLDVGYAGDLSAAERSYQQALAALNRQLGVEQGGRNEIFTRADNEDLTNAAAQTPELQAGDGPAAPAAATPSTKPVAVAPKPAVATNKPVVTGQKAQAGFSEYRNNHGSLVRDYGNGKKQVLVNGIWKWVK